MDQYTSQEEAGCLWRAWRHKRRRHCLCREATVAQWPLWKLVAKPCESARASARVDERREGRVTIDGWYADVEPLGEAERRAIADAPQYDEELKKQLGIKRTEGGGKTLLELINLPSLNINGFASGDVGELWLAT